MVEKVHNKKHIVHAQEFYFDNSSVCTFSMTMHSIYIL